MDLNLALNLCYFWANCPGDGARRRATAWWLIAEALRGDSIEFEVLNDISELLLLV